MRKIWAIADLHLSFGVPNKSMDIFGPKWSNHSEKIKQAWLDVVDPDDLVLIAGDISWATLTEQAEPDLKWIGELPGTKIMIKGNHDYWWGSLKKAKAILPPSCILIQNDSYFCDGVAIGGARLWDVPNLNFSSVIEYRENSKQKEISQNDETADSLVIYQRELLRLESSLKTLNPNANKRIVMTHYPPIGLDMKPTDVSRLLEKYRIDVCVFGHLHNVKPGLALFGRSNGIDYHLTACDFLEHFQPKLIG